MNTHTKAKITEVSKTYNTHMIEVAKALSYNKNFILPGLSSPPLLCIHV